MMPEVFGAAVAEKEKQPRKTRSIRVYEDVADLVEEVARLTGQTTAELISPILRGRLPKIREDAIRKLTEQK